MAANPDILSALDDHVYNATGVRPLSDNGGGGGNPPAKPIPLPNYDDPASRLKYVAAVQQKHNLPHGYGDVFTRFNEVPATQTDTLNTRQLIAKTAAASGLPAPLFYSSAMVEGMSGLYDQKGKVDYSGNEKFPVDGFVNFGLDTFSDAYPGLVKKGYLPADFKNQFVLSKRTNEKNQPVNSANFATAKAALQAKAAMLRDAQDQVQAYADKNKIPLTDKAKQFLTLAYYNGGPGAFQGMVQEAQKGGGFANDAYFQAKPTQSKYGQVWDNVNHRFQLANALTGEQYKFQEPEPPQKQQPDLFKTDKRAFVDSVFSQHKDLDWVKRLYEKNAPSIQLKGLPERSTHYMGDDGKGYVFPTVVRQNGKLVYLGDKAEEYARQTGTGIQFPKEQGDWFADNGYKLGTGVNNSINPQGVPFNNPNYVRPQ